MLDFSPDWDARYCYLVVLVFGLLSARVQVYGRLELLKSRAILAWSIVTTWLVFTTYLVIPLLLFWLLDRTGAIRDTSLFAAVLVGLAYPAVLSGATSLKPNASIGSVFSWLNSAADNLILKTTSKVAVRDRLFSRHVVGHITAHAQHHAAVLQLAVEYADVPADVTREMAATQDAGEKSQIAYDYATSSTEGLKPLSELVAKWKVPGIEAPHQKALRWIFFYVFIVALLGAVAAYAFLGDRGNRWFLVWRLAKPNTSAVDLNRNCALLASILEPARPGAATMQRNLAATLLRPGLDLARADKILSLLLLQRVSPGPALESSLPPIGRLLTDGLRASSIDVRARTQHALELLADEYLAEFPDETSKAAELKSLKEWKPLAADSSVDIERHWKKWQGWWTKPW